MSSLESLPDNLPVPQDDGACAHLIGLELPDLSRPTTGGGTVNLAKLRRKTVIYCYPMTGVPGVALPEGWDDIPGARGCTPQSCAFRDHNAEINALGADVYGLSTQDTAYQEEMATRLHLPFPVISDADFQLTEAISLPTFEADGKRLIKRVTFIIDDGKISAVHYPVFPSHSDPVWVMAQLSRGT